MKSRSWLYLAPLYGLAVSGQLTVVLAGLRLLGRDISLSIILMPLWVWPVAVMAAFLVVAILLVSAATVITLAGLLEGLLRD